MIVIATANSYYCAAMYTSYNILLLLLERYGREEKKKTHL